jgi:hypothetical protein
MENKLTTLKSEFNGIIAIKTNVQNVFDVLQVRINKLKLFYAEFIKNSKNQMFVFGLDSFQFQSKLIDIEFDDMKRLFGAIMNRMYCEYYKLNKIIIDYILKSVDDKKYTDVIKPNEYPIYKDLEPYKDYDFETTLDIHQNILNLVGILMAVLSSKETELAVHMSKQNIGLNINNYTTTFVFNNTILREKIMMFISYIEFFHSLHTKYLKRFSTKIQLMHTHIDTDIRFDEAVEINKETKKGLIEELNSGKIDKALLHDLRKSMSITSPVSSGEFSESEISEEENRPYSDNSRESFSHNSDIPFDRFLNFSKKEEPMKETKNSTTIEPFIVPQPTPSVIVQDSNAGLEYDAVVESVDDIESATPSQKSVFSHENVSIVVEEEVVVVEEEVVVEDEVVEEEEVVVEETVVAETVVEEEVVVEETVVKEEVVIEVVETKKKGKPRKKKGT